MDEGEPGFRPIALVRLINERMQRGQRFLGAIPVLNAVELVFELEPDQRCNLITIANDGIHVGFVADPEAYVDRERPWLDGPA